jgi:hypothetical protein
MRSSSDLLEYYRERAAECELLAELTDYPEYRELCLYMAKRWLTFIDEDDPKTEEIGHFESASSPPNFRVGIHEDRRGSARRSAELA